MEFITELVIFGFNVPNIKSEVQSLVSHVSQMSYVLCRIIMSHVMSYILMSQPINVSVSLMSQSSNVSPISNSIVG